MSGTDVRADLWRFAIKVYGTEGVSDDCLTLQDVYGVDVPVILCALWMATRGSALTPDDMARLAGSVEAWHAEVVKPLRAVRRRLKEGPSPAPSERTEAVRTAVKAAELDAERIELATLAEFAEGFATGAPVAPVGNLDVALAHYAGGPVGDHAPLDQLIRATEVAGH